MKKAILICLLFAACKSEKDRLLEQLQNAIQLSNAIADAKKACNDHKIFMADNEIPGRRLRQIIKGHEEDCDKLDKQQDSINRVITVLYGQIHGNDMRAIESQLRQDSIYRKQIGDTLYKKAIEDSILANDNKLEPIEVVKKRIKQGY